MLDLSISSALAELSEATGDLDVGLFVYNAGSDDGAGLAAYGATKAFDLILAEAQWAEWRGSGVDVLALGSTDTPSLRRKLDVAGRPHGDLADPADVARKALDHLADGPTWIYGSADPDVGSPVGSLSRRDAVLEMSRAAGQAPRAGHRGE